MMNGSKWTLPGYNLCIEDQGSLSFLFLVFKKKEHPKKISKFGTLVQLHYVLPTTLLNSELIIYPFNWLFQKTLFSFYE